MAWEYPKKLLDVSRNPEYIESEVGLTELIKDDEYLMKGLKEGTLIAAKKEIDPNHTLYMSSYGSPACGDMLNLFMLVNTKENTVEKISYYNYGCTSSIAASEMGARIVIEQKKFKDGVFREKENGDLELLITNKKILSQLVDTNLTGEVIRAVPKEKYHCSVMFEQALEHLLWAYQGKTLFRDTLSDKDWAMIEKDEGPLVCHCYDIHANTIIKQFDVINNEVLSLIKKGNIEPDDKESIVDYFHIRIGQMTKAGEACGKCRYDRTPSIDQLILEQYPNYNPAKSGKIELDVDKKSNYLTMNFFEKASTISKVIDEQIKPALALHGGNIELVGLENDVVKVRLTGSCEGCGLSNLTLLYGIQDTLQKKVYTGIKVEQIPSQQNREK